MPRKQTVERARKARRAGKAPTTQAGEFGEGHPFHAVPLPYSRFEIELPRLAPRSTVPVVLLDDGRSDVAIHAARRARSLGYTDVTVLAGGTRAWQAAGYTLFKGVNVVSKAFGELVEDAFGTPSISAEELHERLAHGDDLIVVDGRPLEEFHRMSIPGATCCPNGELAYRIADIAPNPQTTIVVNCAGRTRSLIGAETLRHVGVKNRVYALRNGTMGWRLAGYDLDHGRNNRYPGTIQAGRRSLLVQHARHLSEQWGVPRLDTAKAREWLADDRRTTYLLDVRTAEEFAAGTAPGAQHAPGGQLVQATDQWLGVRGAARA
jgi:rhodanese-related sulfurtransferase